MTESATGVVIAGTTEIVIGAIGVETETGGRASATDATTTTAHETTAVRATHRAHLRVRHAHPHLGVRRAHPLTRRVPPGSWQDARARARRRDAGGRARARGAAAGGLARLPSRPRTTRTPCGPRSRCRGPA